jgi:hypothetical protein
VLGGGYASSIYSVPGASTSKTGYAPLVELPAFLLPRLESDQLVNNGDGTFTRNKYLSFYSRYNTETKVWQALVQSEIKTGTLSFTGSRLFNNKNRYDFITQVLPTSCYVVPLVIDQSTYDPFNSTVSWPSASYICTLTELLTQGNTATEGTFNSVIKATITTTNIAPGTTLRYVFSGTNITADDLTLTGTFTLSSTGAGQFTTLVNNDSIYEGTESLICTITRVNGDPIAGTPGTLYIAEGPTTYTVSAGVTEINEGGYFIVTCTTNKTSSSLAQTVNYTLSTSSGTEFDAEDWTGTVTMGSGSTVTANKFVIPAGQTSVTRTFTTKQDNRTDGDKTLKLQLDGYAGSGTNVEVIVRDTSLEYTWSITGSTTVNEGSTYTYTVTTNAPTGSKAIIVLTSPTTASIADIESVNGVLVTDPPTITYVTTTNGTGTFTVKYKADLTTEGSEYFTLALLKDMPEPRITVATLSGVVTINDTSLSPPAFTFTREPATGAIDEGSNVRVRWTSTGFYPLTIYYKFTGTAKPSTDDGGGTTDTGPLVLGPTNDAGFIDLGMKADHFTEGTETMNLAWYFDEACTDLIPNSSLSWQINDTSLTPVYSVAAFSSADEGAIGSCFVYTTNVDVGTTLYWTIDHVTTDAADFSATSGSFTTVSGMFYQGTFTITPSEDHVTEGAQTFKVQIRINSTSGTVVATSATVTVNDTSKTPSYTFTRSPSSVNEGSSVTIGWNITNFYPITLYYKLTGTNITGGDFDIGVVSGPAAFVDAVGSADFPMTADLTTEGLETVTLKYYSDSGFTTQVGNSVSWNINDTSLTPPPELTQCYFTTGTGTSKVSSVANGSTFRIKAVADKAWSTAYTVVLKYQLNTSAGAWTTYETVTMAANTTTVYSTAATNPGYGLTIFCQATSTTATGSPIDSATF